MTCLRDAAESVLLPLAATAAHITSDDILSFLPKLLPIFR